MRHLLFGVFFLNVLLLSSNVQAGFGENVLRLLHPQENSGESSSERVEVKTIVETSVDVSNIVRNIWTIIQDLFKTNILEIEKKAVDIFRHETKLLSFHKNKFNLLKLKLSDLKLTRGDSLKRVKYLVPLLKRLKSYYYSKKGETADTNELEYYSYAYRIIAEILNVLEENCSNRVVFTTENETEEWDIIVGAKFEINIKAEDLKGIYEKLELLKSKRATIKRDIVKVVKNTVVSTVTRLTQTKNYARVTYNIWATLHNLITFIVESIRTKTTLSDAERSLISFYTQHITVFSDKLDKLRTDTSGDRENIKYLFPVLRRLEAFLQVKTQATNSLTAEFLSEAYTVVKEILSIFKARCSEKSIFSVKDFSQELEILSNSKTLFGIQDKELNGIYSKVDGLRQKLSKISKSSVKSITTTKTETSGSLLDTSELSVSVEIWTLTKDIIKTLVTSLEEKTTTSSEYGSKFLLFYKKYYQQIVSKLDTIETKDFKIRVGYLIPFFKQLKSFFHAQKLIKDEQFGTYAYTTVTEILSLFETKCSDKSLFSVSNSDEELKIISGAKFSISITRSELDTIFSKLKILKQKQVELTLRSKSAEISMTNFITSLKIWTLTQEIIYSVVFSINRKTTTLSKGEEEFISFYREDYPFFALKLNELGTDKNTYESGMVYLVPILKRLESLFHSSSILAHAKTEFYTDAYQNVAEILTILQSGSTNKSIFSVKNAREEQELIGTGFSIKINDEHLKTIWQKLKLLRERQSAFATSLRKTVSISTEHQSTSTTLTQTSEYVRTSTKIWTLISRFVYTVIRSIETKTTILFECETIFMEFYKQHFHYFVTIMNNLRSGKSSDGDTVKYVIPILKRLRSFFHSISKLKVSTLSSAHQSDLIEFHSSVYKTIVEILTSFQKGCSNKEIFTVKTYGEEIKILSATNFRINLAEINLNAVYEKLTTVGQKLTTVDYYASHLKRVVENETKSGLASSRLSINSGTEHQTDLTDSKKSTKLLSVNLVPHSKSTVVEHERSSSLSTISTDGSVASYSRNIWVLTREVYETIILAVKKETTLNLKFAASFLEFYEKYYGQFTTKLNKLSSKNHADGDIIKYLLPILKNLKAFLFSAAHSEKFNSLATKRSELREFHSYAYEVIFKILSVFEKSCSDKTFFSQTLGVAEEIKILDSTKFTLNVEKDAFRSIYEQIRSLKQRQATVSLYAQLASTRKIQTHEVLSENTTSQKKSSEKLSASQNIWILTDEIVYTLIRKLDAKTASSTKFETEFLAYYQKYYNQVASKLRETGSTRVTSKERIKYVIPALKRLRTFFYSLSKTKISSATDSTVTDFYSFAYKTIAEILAIFKGKCTNKYLFSEISYEKEIQIISSSKFNIKIEEEDLKLIYKKIQTLRNRQLTISTGSSNTLVSTFTQSVRIYSKNIFLLAQKIFISLVNSIENRTKSSISWEYDTRLLKFYKEHFRFFVSELKEIDTLKNSYQNRIKFLIPLFNRLKTYFYAATHKTSTTTTITNRSSLTNFYSFAYEKIVDILTVLQQRCSDEKIFFTETFSDEMNILSSDAFTLTLQKKDLKKIYETLSTLRGKQSALFGDTTLRIPGVENGLNTGSEVSSLIQNDSGVITNQASISVLSKKETEHSSPVGTASSISTTKITSTSTHPANSIHSSLSDQTDALHSTLGAKSNTKTLSSDHSTDLTLSTTLGVTTPSEKMSSTINPTNHQTSLIKSTTSDASQGQQTSISSSVSEKTTIGSGSASSNNQTVLTGTQSTSHTVVRVESPSKNILTNSKSPSDLIKSVSKNGGPTSKSGSISVTDSNILKTKEGVSTFERQIRENMRILGDLYRNELGTSSDDLGDKIGSSSTTSKVHQTSLIGSLREVVSYHKRYVAANSETRSVVKLSEYVRFDRKVQDVLFEVIEEFLEWKQRVADFCSAKSLSETCLTDCLLKK